MNPVKEEDAHVFAVPEFYGPVTTRREDDALSSPSHGVYTCGVTPERKLELAELRVPDPDRAVL